MASGSTSTTRPAAASGAERVRYDEFIQDQLQKTRGYVRLVDVVEAVMTIAAAILAYLLLVSLVDHWLLRGGLTFWGRFLAWSVLVVAVFAFAARTLLPHILHRVSSAYAADAIERAEPSLKNSLLNFLMLRGDHRGVPEVVFQGLEQQAALGLSEVPVESAVDRSRMLKIAYALIGIVLVCALYKILSPKDLLPSFGRVLVPWADIQPETRVKILNVQPGDTEVVLLSQVPVSAEVLGLRDDESVTLIYSTADRQAVNVSVPMYLTDGQHGYTCLLPAEQSGLAHEVTYRIEAGDCVSPTWRVQVFVAPTIHVKHVEYRYPAYTGFGTRKVEGMGDLKAIEGTEAIIRAEASHDLTSASMELEGLRNQTLPVKFEGRAVYGRLTLRRKTVGDRSLPQWSGYRLRINTPQGLSNRDPIRHDIEITPDKPPIVEILRPEKAEVELPLDGSLDIELRAMDQDFELSDVHLLFSKGDQLLAEEDVTTDRTQDSPTLGESFRGRFRFVPARGEYDLRPGDVVRYVAAAWDNKTPERNRSETAEYQIVITEPERSMDEGQPGDDRQPDGGDAPGQEGRDGGEGQQEQGGQDSDSNQSQTPQDGTPGDQQEGSGQQGGSAEQGDSGQQQSGDPQNGDGTSNDGAPGQENMPQDGQGGSESTDGQSGQQQGQPAGQQPGSEAQPSDTEPGSSPDPSDSGGQPQDGQRQSGTPQAQEGSPSEAEPSDGPIDNPGDAFEQVLEHMRKKDGQGEGGSSSGQPGNGSQGQSGDQSPGSESPADGSQSEPGDAGGRQADDQSTADDQGSQGQTGDPSGDQPGGEPGDQSGEQAGDQSGDPSGSTGEQQPGEQGTGGDQKSPAGSRDHQDGDGGGGRGNEGQQAPPPAEGQGRPRDKSGSSQQSEGQKEPGDSSVSSHDSDSAEGEQGTASGQGDEGGGQHSAQKGEGAQGRQTPADTGGSPSQESGAGERSSQAGDQTVTDDATGRQGDQPGDASTREGGQPGARQGDDPTDRSPPSDQQGQPGDQPSPAAGQGEGQDQQPPKTGQEGGRAGGATGEGDFQGVDRTRGATPDQGERAEPGADDANLEYARKQTELVLDYLSDQLDKGGIDPELKSKFGWNDEQFAEFVRQHSRLRDAARAAGDEGRRARRELADTLRSLGLQPPGAKLRSGRPTVEKAAGLRESGRTRPPLEYQEQFDAFRKDAFDQR
jgi:hypothetical protein